jgi:hypothetical protein
MTWGVREGVREDQRISDERTGQAEPPPSAEFPPRPDAAGAGCVSKRPTRCDGGAESDARMSCRPPTRWFCRRTPLRGPRITVHEKVADPAPERCGSPPFRLGAPQFHVGRPGSIIDPARDIVPGANRHFFAVQTAWLFERGGPGVGLCPVDSPGWLGERIWKPRRPRISAATGGVREPQQPVDDEFPALEWRRRTSQVGLDVGHYIRSGASHAGAQAQLPAGGPGRQRGRTLPGGRPGWQLDRRGMQITAFGQNPAEVGPAVLELAGREEVRLQWPEDSGLGVAAHGPSGSADGASAGRSGSVRVDAPALRRCLASPRIPGGRLESSDWAAVAAICRRSD